MIRVWPVLLALAVWLPLAADETAPAPDAVWINQFDDPGVLEKETRLEGTRFLVPKTKFYIADEPTASCLYASSSELRQGEVMEQQCRQRIKI